MSVFTLADEAFLTLIAFNIDLTKGVEPNFSIFSGLLDFCYPDVTLAKKPVPHEENLPKPKHPSSFDKLSKNDPSFDTSFLKINSMQKKKHDLTQAELNDLIRGLQLSKRVVIAS
ncbi:unnamed protein product [Brassicogethes aeneus]|uniref:Uncharacterized protein n=1 Tax=Brassicogethes aeneus TaxID=1431903 RepID=A0A9P0ARS7_BRAAE|nr:unnamed protein product [Brassicogethes aeneus]